MKTTDKTLVYLDNLTNNALLVLLENKVRHNHYCPCECQCFSEFDKLVENLGLADLIEYIKVFRMRG